jgi:hypothetical protein
MTTAVEWFIINLIQVCGAPPEGTWKEAENLLQQAKEMEKNNTDNKVIHFAEWLTKKHTSTLITLYEHFEEEYYNETFKSE